MLFLANFEIKNPIRESAFVSRVERSFPKYNRCLPKSFFIISDKDKDGLYKQLRTGLEKEDLLLVVAVPDQSLMGWLPSSSVDWLISNYKL